jgi:hypothetical protein
MRTDSPHFLAIVATLVVVALLILLVTRQRDAATRRRTAARNAAVAARIASASAKPGPADAVPAAAASSTVAPAPAPNEAESLAAALDRMAVQYIEVVDRHVGQLAIDAATLPAPKTEVRRALQILMRNAVDEVARARLANYYVRLAAFQPGPIALPDMTDAPVDWTSLPVHELRELLITVRNDAVSDLLIRIQLEEKRLQKDVQALTALAAQERVLEPD